MPPHAHDCRFTFSAAEADLFHYHRDKKALKLAYIALKFLIKLDTGNKGGPVGTFFYMVSEERRIKYSAKSRQAYSVCTLASHF